MYNDPACFSSGIVNHNVLIVGYNTLAPVPYWLIRNSWGPDWGDSGYMKLAINAADDPSGQSFVEPGAGVCGIYTTPALYPVLASKTSHSQSYAIRAIPDCSLEWCATP